MIELYREVYFRVWNETLSTFYNLSSVKFMWRKERFWDIFLCKRRGERKSASVDEFVATLCNFEIAQIDNLIDNWNCHLILSPEFSQTDWKYTERLMHYFIRVAERKCVKNTLKAHQS